MWRLNSMLLNDHGSLEKSKKKKYLETNDNKNAMIQNLWETAKAVIRGKFYSNTTNLISENKKKSQINNKAYT